LIALLVLASFSPVHAAGEKTISSTEPTIKVGLWANQSNLVISADGNFTIVNRETREVLGQFAAKEKVNVSIKDSRITVNGVAVAVNELGIKLKTIAGDHYIEVNKRRYRGNIDIHRTVNKTGLTVVNTLPLEQYLYGIIAEEISPEWPLEAVKAQAVAARTYALYSLKKHQQDGYDVCATTDCQVYGGINSESVRAIKAVDDTHGQVVVYQGKPIPAFFHASAGGYTENSENVWGTYYSFLRGVEDYDKNAPHYKWEKQLRPAELAEALQRAGYNIGSLRAIVLSPYGQPPLNAFDRGVSGRVKTIKFIGTNNTVQVPGNKLRSILALNSTAFDIKIVVPVEKDIEFRITDSAGDRATKKIEINLPPQEEKGLLNDKEDMHRISGRAGETIVLTGYGWGHGLGMSQWGAKAMAEKAPPGDTTYFKEILKHYYQSTEIKKVY